MQRCSREIAASAPFRPSQAVAISSTTAAPVQLPSTRFKASSTLEQLTLLGGSLPACAVLQSQPLGARFERLLRLCRGDELACRVICEIGWGVVLIYCTGTWNNS